MAWRKKSKTVDLPEEKKEKKPNRFLCGIKKHKFLTFLLVVILIAAIVAGLLFQRKSQMPDMAQTTVIETATIEKMDLSNSISVTGTIATAASKTGSTTLSNIEVTAVYVEVGDAVEEGDIICTFDSSDYETALANAKNNYSINQQLDAYDDYEETYQEALSDAEESLQETTDECDSCKSEYETAVSDEESALSTYNSALSKYNSLATAYETAKAELIAQINSALASAAASSSETTETVTEDSLDNYLKSSTLPSSCTDAYTAYQSAKSAYETAAGTVSSALADYEAAQQETASAYEIYQQYESQLEAAEEQYDLSVEQATEAYEKAKLQDQLISDDSELDQIESYEEQIADCVVYAAMSGTITSLSVEEGETFSGGSIYEIQDTEYFIVEATVDEYDITSLAKGMNAYVKTDSVDEEMAATVTYVAVTGTSGATMGSSSGTASYEIEITINDPQDMLRSGMTASVSIALEESNDTLAVPYDCVQTNANGESVIYVDDNGERKEIVVDTGIETDYYTEVISDEISEGMTVYLTNSLTAASGSGSSDSSDENMSSDFNFDFDTDSGFSGGGGGGGGMPSGGMGGF